MIATSALASLFLEDLDSNNLFQQTSYFSVAIFHDRSKFIEKVISQSGIDFKGLQRSIFACIFCAFDQDFVGDEIVIAREGLILYPAALFSPRIEKQGALNLALHPGTIRLDSLNEQKLNHKRYRYVREVSQKDNFSGFSSSEVESVKAFSGSKYLGLIPKTDWMAKEPDFFAVSSIKGDSIFVKPTLRIYRSRPTNSKMPVHQPKALSAFDNSPHKWTSGISTSAYHEVHFTYLEALEGLACCLYVPRSGTFTTSAEKSLAVQLRRELDCTAWLCPSSQMRVDPDRRQPGKTNQSSARFIVHTGNNPHLAFYQLSMSQPGSLRYVLVERGCNLVKAVQGVEKEWGCGWVIIM